MWLANLYAKSRSKRELTSPYIIGIILIYTIIFGLRYDVGVDHTAYLKSFLYLGNHPGVMVFREPLWVGLITLLHKIDAHYTIFFLLVAFVQILFLCKAFTIKKNLVPYFFFIFIACGYFLTFQNAMRQAVSFAIMFCVLMRYPDIGFLKYLAMVAVLFLFHLSAIFLIFLYPLVRYDQLYIRPTWLRAGLFIFAAVIGATTNVFDAVVRSDIFLVALDSTEYVNYKHNLDMGMERTYGAGYILKCVINLILFVNGDNMCRYFKDQKGIKRWFNMYYVGSVIMALFPSSMLIARLFDYLTIWAIPVYSYFAYYIVNTKFKYHSFLKTVGYASLIGLVALNINTIFFKPAGMHSLYHFWTEAPYPGYQYYFQQEHKEGNDTFIL